MSLANRKKNQLRNFALFIDIFNFLSIPICVIVIVWPGARQSDKMNGGGNIFEFLDEGSAASKAHNQKKEKANANKPAPSNKRGGAASGPRMYSWIFTFLLICIGALC